MDILFDAGLQHHGPIPVDLILTNFCRLRWMEVGGRYLFFSHYIYGGGAGFGKPAVPIHGTFVWLRVDEDLFTTVIE